MKNWNTLKTAITKVIRENGNQEITGSNLQSTLLGMVSALGANRTYVGLASPSTAPLSYDGPVFYIAAEPGVYTNFGDLSVAPDELAFILNTETGWQIQAIKLNAFIKNSVDIGLNSAELASCLEPGFYEVLNSEEKAGFLLTTYSETHGSYRQYLFGDFNICSDERTLVEMGSDNFNSVSVFSRYLTPEEAGPWQLIAPQKTYSQFDLSAIEDAISDASALSRVQLTQMLTPEGYTYYELDTVWPSVGDVLGKEDTGTYLVVASRKERAVNLTSVKISFIREAGAGINAAIASSSYALYTLLVSLNVLGAIVQCALYKSSIPLEQLGSMTIR